MKQRIELNVNGQKYEVFAEPNAMLADVLREDLRFTGVKKGCDWLGIFIAALLTALGGGILRDMQLFCRIFPHRKTVQQIL